MIKRNLPTTSRETLRSENNNASPDEEFSELTTRDTISTRRVGEPLRGACPLVACSLYEPNKLTAAARTRVSLSPKSRKLAACLHLST